MKKYSYTALASMVSMSVTLMICQSVTHASDIEIYSNSTNGKTTITLMLDTSGSMSIEQVGSSACDIPSGATGTVRTDSISSGTTPSYTRRYCEVEGERERRYYFMLDNKTWYSCVDRNGSTNRGQCNNKMSVEPTSSELTGLTAKRFDFWGDEKSCNKNNYCYYFKDINTSSERYYDRLTRLKDAIFALLDSNLIDPTLVSIGIGNFSAQSGSDNVYTRADGASGKILVPAALLNSTQKGRIKTAVADLRGSNGTPTANAYAEVGAYMLGTNTTAVVQKDMYVSFTSSGGSTRYGLCVERYSDELTCSRYTTDSYITNPAGYNQRREAWSSAIDIRTILSSDTSLTTSGFTKSVSTSKSDANYISPLTTNNQCNGQGIYFLTDGEPNSSPNPLPLMKAALGSNGSSFSLPTTGNLPNGSQSGHGTPFVGEFAKALRSKTRNPKGMEIKTAVVGFGSIFDVDKQADLDKPEADRVIRSLTDAKGTLREYYNCSKIPTNKIDARNACNWGARSHTSLPDVGGFGEGGFYSAQSSDDIITSIVKFLDEVKPEFDPVVTGSPTIPVDSLNPTTVLPYAYYSSFIPKPQESTQLWVGNLNKYNIFNGQLYNADNTIKLIKTDGSIDRTATGLWGDGVVSRLPLRTGMVDDVEFTQRKVFTNRAIEGSAAPYTVVSQTNNLVEVSLDSLFSNTNNIDDSGLLKNDPDKNFWLNVLGYNVPVAENVSRDRLTEKPELRQLGSVMHSTPIQLTQEGRVYLDKNNQIKTEKRKDYLLFGSTQGILHVVDSTGKEVFAFVPNEIMESQKVAFLTETSSTSGKNNLFYGVDAPWTAYTKYVSKTDGTLTVQDSGRLINKDDEDNDETIKGLQWVYGGLRMGGYSYYGLDLTYVLKAKRDESNPASATQQPKLMFVINPKAESASEALQRMGQSWSKPTITHVNWNGEKRLVMFVGGGYDPIYEDPAANPTTSFGNGVYMFDAMTGELLWWASSEAKTGAIQQTINTDLNYSVVSQINILDRDSDGLADQLYFGDLGGQGFRVDINNAKDTDVFAPRVVTLFKEAPEGQLKPRFYDMPSVSIHLAGGKYFAAVAFSSGNRSSPLAGLTGSNTVSAKDGLFVAFDNDVAKSTLFDADVTLDSENLNLEVLNLGTGVQHSDTNGFKAGWKYYYSNNNGEYKGMNGLYALDSILYTNVYHRDGVGIGGNCGAGVKGDSYLYQFCLPTGRCSFYIAATAVPNRVKLGGGILGAGVGQGYLNQDGTLGLVVDRDVDKCKLPENKNKPECQLFDNSSKLKQMRWYETQ
ncbi:PilC/PilY family type IV pilus protein [Acinetobacter johnsonii]|uniref:PilC/PilY family type IV pilus protein n=1 Tax=Acinetobacter johnsonii TaxID=40214 RepID=UPI001F16FE6F|nr:PilC/PilY family type IV pilus protein [Acinetobacter johnsonii]